MRAETLRARKEERVRKKIETTHSGSVEPRKGGGRAARRHCHGPAVSMPPRRGGQCLPPLVSPLLLHAPSGAGRARGLPERGVPQLGAGSPQETLASPLCCQEGLGSPQIPP